MRWFGREPAVLTAAVVSALQFLSLLLGLHPDVQGYVNGALVAVGGVVVAAALGTVEGVLPAALGAIKAGFALVLALGVHWPDTYQVVAVGVVTVLGSLFVRQNVNAPIDAQGARLRF